MDLLALSSFNAWLVYFGVLWALAYLVTMSSIFSPVRAVVGRQNLFLLTLIFCPTCCAFWIGLTLGGVGFFPLEMFWPYRAVVAALLSVSFSSAVMAVFFHGQSPAAAEMQALIEWMVREHPEKLPEHLRDVKETHDESTKETQDE